MARPSPILLAVLFVTLGAALLPAPILAQYIYLDTNGDGIHSSADIVQQNGITNVDVYLGTNSNRYGSQLLCPEDPSMPLTIFSYGVTLRAESGTVDWQAWEDRMSFPIDMGDARNDTDVFAARGGGSELPPGIYKLGHTSFTVTSGVPRISIAAPYTQDPLQGTYFGSRCWGQNFDNIVRLGVDWGDADGADNPANQPPSLSAIEDMVVEAGSVATQSITASDAEGEPIQLTKSYGQDYVTVSTEASGPGTVMGTIRVAPQPQIYARRDTAAVTASDGFASVTDTFRIYIRQLFSILSLSGSYDLRAAAGQIATELVTANDPDGDASEIRFELVSGPSYASVTTLALANASTAQGEIRVSPGTADIGSAPLTFVAIKGTLRVESTIGITVVDAAPANHAPWVLALPDLYVRAGTSPYIWLVGYDPDGDLLTARKLVGPPYVDISSVPGYGINGVVYMHPSVDDLGVALVEIGMADGWTETKESFTVTVGMGPRPPNRAPIADAGGPYTAKAGEEITFNGFGTQDPDGDIFFFLWSFGDGTSSGYLRPLHAYGAPGTYKVVLSVSDRTLTGVDSTLATITQTVEARAFVAGEGRVIPLTAGGRSDLAVYLEPVAGDYLSEDLDIGSIVMKSDATGGVSEIHTVDGKTVRSGDVDRNGVDDVSLRFRRVDLAALLSNIRGRTDVDVEIEGMLRSGARVHALLTLTVVAMGGHASARAYPNPFNPSGTLAIVTTAAGPLDVRLYDVSGRLVRVLAREEWVPAGNREVTIDGHDAKGAALASGVYFYRVQSAKQMLTGRLTIAR